VQYALGDRAVLDLSAPLGQGGASLVWAGRWGRSGLPVAVKVERAPHAEFAQEVRAVARLDHPGIIAVWDHGVVPADAPEPLVPGGAYLVMERAQENLRAHCGRISPPAVIGIARVLLAALGHAHARGVLHRDLKPGNVLLVGREWKLSDFGLACPLEAESGNEEEAQGTPAYMAPEQFEADWRAFGPWTDLYALGCLLWTVLTGEPPFGRGHWTELRRRHRASAVPALPAGLPRPLGGWLRTLLAKEPKDRFQRASDARAALDAVFPDGDGAEPRSTTGPVIGGLSLFGLRPLPLIGRGTEQRRLTAALAASRDGPVAVVLHGPAGCGKSRLASDLCEEAHERQGAHVLRAVHAALPGPADGVGPMLARLLRVHGLEREDVAQRLASMPDADAVADVIRPEAAADTGFAVISLRGPQQRYAAIERVVHDLARDRPVVVWIDDAQWGADAVGFVAHALAAGRAQALFVLTVRDEALVDRPEAEALSALPADRIPIGPLPEAEHTHLVRSLLGFSGEVVERVVARTAGNPLFAVHLVEDWVHRGVLRRTAGRLQLDPAARLDIPDDLHALWGAHLERVLGGVEDDERALEVASALGPEVDPREWAAACAALGVAASDELLGTLFSTRLARAVEGGAWAFVHPMLSETLERRARERGRLGPAHRACARMLAERGGAMAEERRARHCLAAGDHELALSPLLAAVAARLRSGEVPDAEALQARWDEAMVASGLPEADLRWGEGWLSRAGLLGEIGRPEEAEAWARRVVDGARQHGWPFRARALQVRGRFALVLGNTELAHAMLREAEDLADRAGDRQARGFTRRDLGDLFFHTGKLEKAARLFGSAASDLKAVGAMVGLGSCWLGLGGICQRMKLYDEAAAHVARARGCFAGLKYRLGEANCACREGELARLRGELEHAETHYREAARLFRGVRDLEVPAIEINLALVQIQRQRFAEARVLLMGAIEVLSRNNRLVWAACAHACLLPCLASAADWPAFERHLRAAAAGIATYVDDDVAGVLDLGGRMAADAGKPELARGAWVEAARHYRALGRRRELEEVEGRLG
jgi:tetratricopeptide (TPR) repeat protein